MRRRSSGGLRKKFLERSREIISKQDKIFNEYIERLKTIVPESTIILYGSRARGKYSSYSDYDLAIILKNVDDKFNTIKYLRSFKPHGFSLDLTIYSLPEIEDPIVRKMFKHRKILYDKLGISNIL